MHCLFSTLLQTFLSKNVFVQNQMGRVERWTSHFIFWTVCARLLLGLFWTLLQINHPIDGWFSYGMTAANLVHFIMCADYIYYFVRSNPFVISN